MSRRGMFSLATYILYTLFWGGISLWLYWAVKTSNPGLAGIAVAIVMAATMVLAIGCLLAVILKLIHIGTRWKLFGIICILIDGYILYSLIPALIGIGAVTGTTFVLLVPIVLSVGSLLDNLSSLSF